MTFDRCANKLSLLPPPAAVEYVARHARASGISLLISKDKGTANAVPLSLAGAEGLEPSARGFGDHCSTN